MALVLLVLVSTIVLGSITGPIMDLVMTHHKQQQAQEAAIGGSSGDDGAGSAAAAAAAGGGDGGGMQRLLSGARSSARDNSGRYSNGDLARGLKDCRLPELDAPGRGSRRSSSSGTVLVGARAAGEVTCVTSVGDQRVRLGGHQGPGVVRYSESQEAASIGSFVSPLPSRRARVSWDGASGTTAAAAAGTAAASQAGLRVPLLAESTAGGEGSMDGEKQDAYAPPGDVGWHQDVEVGVSGSLEEEDAEGFSEMPDSCPGFSPFALVSGGRLRERGSSRGNSSRGRRLTEGLMGSTGSTEGQAAGEAGPAVGRLGVANQGQRSEVADLRQQLLWMSGVVMNGEAVPLMPPGSVEEVGQLMAQWKRQQEQLRAAGGEREVVQQRTGVDDEDEERGGLRRLWKRFDRDWMQPVFGGRSVMLS